MFLPIRARSNQNLLGAIALDQDRTLGRIIRLETKRSIARSLKGDRSTGIFKVLGIAIAT